MRDFIDDFKRRIQAKIKGIEKSYEIRDIYIKENNDTGKCITYLKKESEKISNSKVRVFLANIEDERDIISYKIIGFPGGRCSKINEHADIFSLYNFGSMFHALHGEEKMPYAMITKHDIDKLISLYEAQKQSMKYYELEEVRCKGKTVYIGSYSEQGGIVEEELFGNVLSEFGWEEIDRQTRRTLVNSICLRDFRQQRRNLNFTKNALQNIIERNRNIESK